jgi:hypothetical protein
MLRAAKHLRMRPFAALMATSTRANRLRTDLDRQEWFSPVRRQVGIERVDEQRQQTIVPHDQAQLHDSLAAKLLKRGLEGPRTDTMGTEKFPTIVYDRCLVRRQFRERLTVPQGIHKRIAYACLAR